MEIEKHSVLVNADRCVGCGLCTKDCVSGAITLKDGKAAVTGEGCIFCGHCEAICPNGAVSLTGFQESSEEYEKQTRLDPEELLKAIKTRRSVRVFADAMIPDSVTDSIIEAGRLAPTGANAQNTGFIVLGSKQNDAEKMALSLFRKLMKAGKPFIPFLKDMEFGDVLFSLINYGRFVGINAEDALEKSNKKFIKRFQILEHLAKEKGLVLGEISLVELEELWNLAKIR